MSFLNKMKQISNETEEKEQKAKDEQHRRMLNLIDAQCERLIGSLQSDIEKDARGERYWDSRVMGSIEYYLQNEKGSHLKLEKYAASIIVGDIKTLPAFAKLKAHCEALAVIMELGQRDVEHEHVIYIRISGWK